MLSYSIKLFTIRRDDMIIKITRESALRDKTVLELLHSLSLSSKMIKALKYRDDGISVNGEHKTVRYVLAEGDVISLALDDDRSSQNAPPSDIPIDIIYEDSEIIAINKPPFMPTHTSHNHHNDTLANAVAGYFQKKSVPFIFRPINRLDRNTSGIVLIAKNKYSAALLTREMKERRFKKSYLAYLEGELGTPERTVEFMDMTLGVIDNPIRRAKESIIFREVCSHGAPNAEEALTYYRILRSCKECTEIEVWPQSGRTHQLRVHFASLGHPIMGDDLYGSESPHIKRHALHARSLEFILPTPIEKLGDPSRSIILTAPIPEDLLGIQNKFFN